VVFVGRASVAFTTATTERHSFGAQKTGKKPLHLISVHKKITRCSPPELGSL
jgi:hypothetical protein